MDLDKLRKEIDTVDQTLVEAFEDRMELVQNISKFKIENKLPIYNGTREQEVIDLAISRLRDKNLNELTREFFSAVMQISKELQGKILGKENLRLLKEQGGRIVYPGVEGSFSGQATREFFGDTALSEAVPSFKEVCRQVADGSAKFGVLPIENTISGSVLEVIDRIEEFDCHVVGEHRIRLNTAFLVCWMQMRRILKPFIPIRKD